MIFNQEFQVQDLAVVGLLVVLEGVLSIDNALVLGLLARRVPKHQRAKALTLGLVGAFVFRLLAISVASWLLKSTIAKLLGGLYLFYVAGKYFWDLFWAGPEECEEENTTESLENVEAKAAGDEPPLVTTPSTTPPVDKVKSDQVECPPVRHAGFWSTVLVIELTDIAFAVDSIVAAIGVVGPPPDNAKIHPKLWVVLFGGFIGVILMRYAATMFIKLLEKFPRFETAAYLLVLVIGGKLVLDWQFNAPNAPAALDFHSPKSLTFWIFWVVMTISFCVGFLPKKEKVKEKEKPSPGSQPPAAQP